MYQFLGILLKMPLISLDVVGFKSLWYPPTHATISPTFQFKIKDYPSWTKGYMSYSKFVQILAALHPESGTSQEQDKCHQLRNAIKHLNKTAKCKFVLEKEMSFNEGDVPSKSNYIPISHQTIKQQQIG